jgi:beta-glucanase (GH16 family)
MPLLPRRSLAVPFLLAVLFALMGVSAHDATAAARGRDHHRHHYRHRHHTARRLTLLHGKKKKPGSGGSGSGSTGPTGTLVFDDEFNGTAGSLPDPTKWQLTPGPSGAQNGELECYTNSPSNVALDGQGHLAITARVGSGSCPYTSGRLQTAGLFQTEYGTLEASIQVPAGQGLWPAFWALGSDYPSVGWPQCGEIDVMENLGQDPFTVYGSIHGPDGTGSYGYTTPYRSPVSLASGFHTYAVTWSPTSISYSVDGVTYATYTPSTLKSGQQWVFDQPFYLLLNLAVGGSWPGSPSSSTPFPATMLLDWVRVYS